MTAQQEVAAEIEILFGAMARELTWKACSQSTPRFLTFDDGGDLANLEPRQSHEEGSRQVCPKRVAVEVSTMQRVPRRVHCVTIKRRARIVPLAHHCALDCLDGDALGAEAGAPVGL